MTGVSATIDNLPDNDSFLPRYLTVQLLSILANAIEAPADTDQSSKFIEQFEHKDLFTPLTYSIFWRNGIDQTLQDFTDDINDTDQYNRTALTIAIANENFTLATSLINKGANVFLEDKIVLEIALMSMLQRDNSIMQKIIDAATEYDQIWVSDYLEYLNGYAMGQPLERPSQYRDVLNPPIRHYGQVLDTLVYFNGVPSHYGFLSPSLNFLCQHLENYEEENFAAIAKAYAYSCDTCKFHGNWPTSTNYAQILSSKIQTNIQSSSLEPVLLFGGWAGDALALAFIKDTLIFSNLGIGGALEHGTKIYKVKNQNAITEQFVDMFVKGLGGAADPKTILAAIGEIVDDKPLYSLEQKLNPVDNCIFINPRAVIEGILLVGHVAASLDGVTHDSLTAESGRVADMYEQYLNSLYESSTNDLAIFMRNSEMMQDKRLECCSLALEYINQHYLDNDGISRCIELKNALEFVGLSNYYTSNISPEAKHAIQEHMIHEQEVCAVQVIEKEYEILGKQQ